MKNSFKKRAGRAAIAGATLLGLTAGGIAAAVPASAATSNTITGPLTFSSASGSTTYVMGNDSVTVYKSFYSLSNWQAADKSSFPAWTYPAVGSIGPVVTPAGKCMTAPSSYDLTTNPNYQLSPMMATCSSSQDLQQWTAVEDASGNVDLRLASYPAWSIGMFSGTKLIFGQDRDPATNSYAASTRFIGLGMSVGTPSALERALTSPVPGATITPDTVFTGTGAVGDVVVVTDKAGTVLGSVEVGDDGTWNLSLSPAPVNGSIDLTVVMSGDDGALETVADGTYTMTGSEEPNAYTGPTSGTITPDTVFTGTGTKGETVTITDDEGNVVGTTVVGDDGQWSLTLDPAPINGDLNLTVKIGDETVANPSVTMTGSDEAPGYTGPADGATITPDTEFTGTGGKGDTVTVTDKDGNVLGSTTVGNDGQWSLKLDPAPRNGDVNLVVTVGDEKVADTNLVMTGSDEAPAYSGPADGATITPDTEFTGTGPNGETVTITDKDGNVLGSTTVGDDGQWSLKLDPAPKNGDVNLIVTVGDEKVADTNLVMTGSDEERALTSPEAGSAITPDTEFAGTGNIGDTVTIKDKDGNVLGSAEVGPDGTWSTTLSPAPNNGDTNLIIEITGKDGDTVQLADNTYEMTDSTNGFEVLTPNLSESNTIPNGTVFTGKGEPGTTIEITDQDGNTVGQAEVDTEGNWSAPITGLPQGPNNLTITHTAPGEDPVSTDLGGIVVVSEDEATPLMDPTIAGGTALALLAAAGSVLLIRRRRTASSN